MDSNIKDFHGDDENFWDGEMSAPAQIIEEIGDLKITDDNTATEVLNNEHRETLVYNTRALDKYASTYKLETFEKNYLAIFNQENVDGFRPRVGTEKDVEALERTFSQFNFEIHEHKDLTKDKIMEQLKVCKYLPMCYWKLVIFFSAYKHKAISFVKDIAAIP